MKITGVKCPTDGEWCKDDQCLKEANRGIEPQCNGCKVNSLGVLQRGQEEVIERATLTKWNWTGRIERARMGLREQCRFYKGDQWVPSVGPIEVDPGQEILGKSPELDPMCEQCCNTGYWPEVGRHCTCTAGLQLNKAARGGQPTSLYAQLREDSAEIRRYPCDNPFTREAIAERMLQASHRIGELEGQVKVLEDRLGRWQEWYDGLDAEEQDLWGV
jgi:hypothetical protein